MLLAPAEFLELAESMGMLTELGGWVLAEAAGQAAEWQRETPGFELNVNLSASQLGNPSLVDEVREVLERTGLPAHLLVLELTESVALVDLQESARVLGDLGSRLLGGRLPRIRGLVDGWPGLLQRLGGRRIGVIALSLLLWLPSFLR